MELGLGFEDEDLAETRDRSAATILTSFNAKVCTPLWFEREVSTVDETVSDNNSQLLKLNADFQYYKGNYKAASEFYMRSLEVLPTNSAATRLDIHQSVCRCYLQLGRVTEAEEISQNLTAQAQNADQKKQVALLRLEVLQALTNHAETERCLVRLIGQQPHLSQLWLHLAEIIRKLDTGSDPEVTVKLVTCYVRVRLLLQSTMSAVSRELQQRDLNTITMVERRLQVLGVSPELLQQAKEGLRFDLKLEREDQTDGDKDQGEGDQTQQAEGASKSYSRHSQLEDPMDFYKFWCNWAPSRPT